MLCSTVSLSPLAFGGTCFVPSVHGSFAVLLKHICADACETFAQSISASFKYRYVEPYVSPQPTASVPALYLQSRVKLRFTKFLRIPIVVDIVQCMSVYFLSDILRECNDFVQHTSSLIPQAYESRHVRQCLSPWKYIIGE